MNAAMHRSTIIVGAGMAGLACARRLHDAGRPFLLISENIGGRILRSRQGAMNLGAYYVRADYHYVNQFVDFGRRLDTLQVRRHDSVRSYTYWDRRMLAHLPQGARFLRHLVRFRRHYERLKQRTPEIGQAVAIRSDPWMSELYGQPATEFAAAAGIGDFARNYLAPGVHGTTFCSIGDVTAFTLLLGAMPFLSPAYEFTLRPDRLVAGIEQSIVLDSVTSLAMTGAGYVAETRRGRSLTAQNIVVATPPHVAARLLRLPVVKRPANINVFAVAGSPRPEYGGGDLHLFSEMDATAALARQRSGHYLLASRRRRPDFSRHFARWRLLDQHRWSPAFNIMGTELLECEQGPGVYLIGDHNIVGLEDAALTGLYAAAQIIGCGRSAEIPLSVSASLSPG